MRDIDIVQKAIDVRQTISEVEGRLSIAETKSRASRRTISAPPFLVDELLAHLGGVRADVKPTTSSSPGRSALPSVAASQRECSLPRSSVQAWTRR